MTEKLTSGFKKNKINLLTNKVKKVANSLTKDFRFNINTSSDLHDIISDMKKELPIGNSSLTSNNQTLNKSCKAIAKIFGVNCNSDDAAENCAALASAVYEESAKVYNDHNEGNEAIKNIVKNLSMLNSDNSTINNFVSGMKNKLNNCVDEEPDEINVIKHINNYFRNESIKPKEALSHLFDLVYQYSSLVNKTVEMGKGVKNNLSELKSILHSSDPVNSFYKNLSLSPRDDDGKVKLFLQHVLAKDGNIFYENGINAIKHKDLNTSAENMVRKNIDSFVMSFQTLMKKLVANLDNIVEGLTNGSIYPRTEVRYLGSILSEDLQITDFSVYYAIVRATNQYEDVIKREDYMRKLINLSSLLENLSAYDSDNGAFKKAHDTVSEILSLINSYQKEFLEIKRGRGELKNILSKNLMSAGKKLVEDIHNGLIKKGSYENIESLLEANRKSTVPYISNYSDKILKAISIATLKNRYKYLHEEHERNLKNYDSLSKEGIDNARSNLNKYFGDGNFKINKDGILTFKNGDTFRVLPAVHKAPPDVQRKLIEAKYLAYSSLLDIGEALDTFLSRFSLHLLKNPEKISATLLENLFKLSMKMSNGTNCVGSLPTSTHPIAPQFIYANGVAEQFPYFANGQYSTGGPYIHGRTTCLNPDPHTIHSNLRLITGNNLSLTSLYNNSWKPIALTQVANPTYAANTTIPAANNSRIHRSSHDYGLRDTIISENYLIERYNYVKTFMENSDIKLMIEMFTEITKLSSNDSNIVDKLISPVDLYDKYLNYLAFKDVMIFGKFPWPTASNNAQVAGTQIPLNTALDGMLDNNGNMRPTHYGMGAVVCEPWANIPANDTTRAMFNIDIKCIVEDGILQPSVVGSTDFGLLHKLIIYSLAGGICAVIDNFSLFKNLNMRNTGLRSGVIRPILGGGGDETTLNVEMSDVEICVRSMLLVKLYDELFKADGSPSIFDIDTRQVEGSVFSELRIPDGMSSFFQSCINPHKTLRDTNIIVDTCRKLANGISKKEDVCYGVLRKIITNVCEKIGYGFKDKYSLQITRPMITNNIMSGSSSSIPNKEFKNGLKIKINNTSENFAQSDENVLNAIGNLMTNLEKKISCICR